MTIGIGLLATDASRTPKPNSLIFLADTKGSFGQTYSMNRLHKIFRDDEVRLYAVAADRIDYATSLFTLISKMLHETFKGRGYTDVQDAVHAASDLFKRSCFRYDVLPQHVQPPLSIPELFTEKDLTPELLEEWRKFYFRCQMIVGAMLGNGQCCLFYIDGSGGVENFTFPGFAAIGSGAQNAMFWLSYRNQHLGNSIKHSAYHGFEAKLMAESSAFVNDKCEMLVVTSEGPFELNDFKPQPKNVLFTLAEMRKMFASYGPRSTDGLTQPPRPKKAKQQGAKQRNK